MNKTLKIGVVIDNDLISNYLADLITWSNNTEDIDISSYLYLHNYEEKQIINNCINESLSILQPPAPLNAEPTDPLKKILG